MNLLCPGHAQALLCTDDEMQQRLHTFAADGGVSYLKRARLSTSGGAPAARSAAHPAADQRTGGAPAPEPAIASGTAQQQIGQRRAPMDDSSAPAGGLSPTALSPRGCASPVEPDFVRAEGEVASLNLFMTEGASSPLETLASCLEPSARAPRNAPSAAAPSSAAERPSRGAPLESWQRGGNPISGRDPQDLEGEPQDPGRECPALLSPKPSAAAAAAPLQQTQYGPRAGHASFPACALNPTADPPPARRAAPVLESQLAAPAGLTCSETQSLGPDSPLDREDSPPAAPARNTALSPAPRAAARGCLAPVCATQFGEAVLEEEGPAPGGVPTSGGGSEPGLYEQAAGISPLSSPLECPGWGVPPPETTATAAAAAVTAAATVALVAAPGAVHRGSSEPVQADTVRGAAQAAGTPHASAHDPAPSQDTAGGWWAGGWRVSASRARPSCAGGLNTAEQPAAMEGAPPAEAAGASLPDFADGSASQALRQVRASKIEHYIYSGLCA